MASSRKDSSQYDAEARIEGGNVIDKSKRTNRKILGKKECCTTYLVITLTSHLNYNETTCPEYPLINPNTLICGWFHIPDRFSPDTAYILQGKLFGVKSIGQFSINKVEYILIS